MSNMSYCRMENTFRDFLDCLENFEKVYSENERYYRERLYELAKELVEDYEGFDFSEIASYEEEE